MGLLGLGVGSPAGFNLLPFSFPLCPAFPTEAADGNSTLGGGNGTMGLSARYGPQFTLQHVPDYRQNVYIPGSNATLTNAAGKRDAKNAAPAGGNKKKSGKKEKK